MGWLLPTPTLDENHTSSVFAVDERRRVYWYHPAWTTPAENPVGVAIATDDAIHEIAQVIDHRLEGGRVQLFGLFADLAGLRARAGSGRLPGPGGGADGRLQLHPCPANRSAHLDCSTVLDKE